MAEGLHRLGSVTAMSPLLQEFVGMRSRGRFMAMEPRRLRVASTEIRSPVFGKWRGRVRRGGFAAAQPLL